jgi:predicted RNase H-like HicB family nuclease
MITAYLQAAMHRAHYELFADDHEYYGQIPGFDGVWAAAPTLEACRDELAEVLEEWILLRVATRLPIPTVDGLELKIQGVA